MIKYLLAAALLTTATLLSAQEGSVTTQALVVVESKTQLTPQVSNLTLKVENRNTPLTNLTKVVPNGAQIAILIDDGVRISIGYQLDTIRSFIQHLPPGVEIFIGYLRNGDVEPVRPFTSDYAAAAKSIRLPAGPPGISGSPYFGLSAFVKQWPEATTAFAGPSAPKARFVMMITNGVDPYTGVNPLNQDSPNVSTAVKDAQRAGVAVYSMYYSDAGIRGGAASFSGQGYLTQLSEGTGATCYTQGTGSPVFMVSLFRQFQNAIAQTYIATFAAPGNNKLVEIKFSTKLPGTKVHSAAEVHPGTMLSGGAQ